MAQDLERLVVQLSADVKKYENALNRANGITNQRARAIESRFKKMNSTIAASYGGMASGAIRAFALIGGAQGFKTLSDSATRIDNSLKVAGLSGEELERTYTKLRNSAQANAAPLETLVQLYGRVSLVQGELGITSDQLTGFSNNVAMALRAQGGSSQEASGALLQLAQALGGGVVRAEEFNSIIEGAPTILQAAAAGIKEAGGSVSKLRTIMLDGGLSSKAFFDGINAGAPILSEKLANATLTIDQRMENLRTSLVDAAREFNNSSKAAEVFGSEIDRVSQFVSNVNFETLIGEIQRVVAEFNAGAVAAQGFAAEVGKLSGLAGIGDSIVEALGGKNGKVEFLGDALGIQSTISGEEKLTDLAGRRLEIESQIAEVKSNPANALGQAELRQLESQLAAVNEQSSKFAGNISGGPLDYNKFPPPKPTATVKPISLADPQYQPTASATKKSAGGGGGGRSGGGSRENEYQREIEQIQQRTAALQAETTAQAGLNPLINDYGFAVEYASAKQDLLTAAQEAGLVITPELEAGIDKLAKAYGNAVVESERLSESQQKMKAAVEDFKSTSKDITSGFISDLRSGTSAADALSNALNKVLDKVIDIGLNSLFSLGGGGGGFLGSLLSIFGFKDGGIIHAATGGKIRGPGSSRSDSIPAMLSNGEFVVNAAATKKYAGLLEAINSGATLKLADGGYARSPVSAPTLPSIGRGSMGGSSKDVVTVVLQDDSGRMASIADQRIQTASGTIVNVAVTQANKTAPAAVARYQQASVGGDYRN